MIRRELTSSSSPSSARPPWTCRLPSRNLVPAQQLPHFHEGNDDNNYKDNGDDDHHYYFQLQLAALVWKELCLLTHSSSLPSEGDSPLLVMSSRHRHHHQMLLFCVRHKWKYVKPGLAFLWIVSSLLFPLRAHSQLPTQFHICNLCINNNIIATTNTIICLRGRCKIKKKY